MDPVRRLRVPDPLRDFLRSLPPNLKKRVRAALDRIVADPRSGKGLKGDLAGLRTYRVGSFRVVYREAEGTNIDLIAVGPRATIYEELKRMRRRGPA